MKRRISTLLSVLMFLPVFAHADSTDQINRLKMQVEMLTDQVAKLRSEVDELKRQRFESRRTPATASAAGTYMLNPQDIENVITQLAIEQTRANLETADKETRTKMIAAMKEEARRQSAKMQMDVILHADGTFDTSGKFDGQLMNASGNWSQKGDRLEIATTVEGGVKLDEPVRKFPRLVDGDLVFPPDDELTFELILRRQ